jgi:hypothetical protein
LIIVIHHIKYRQGFSTAVIGRAGGISRPRAAEAFRAFSSEVDTGSREENVSKQKLEPVF